MTTDTPPRARRARRDAYDNIPADKGCHLHPSCLSCPRPACIYDEAPGSQYERAAAEKQAQIAALRAQGVSVDAMVPVLGFGRRTIYRHLALMKGRTA